MVVIQSKLLNYTIQSKLIWSNSFGPVPVVRGIGKGWNSLGLKILISHIHH